jgi:hypothetical protein
LADTIREFIIAALVTKLSEIALTNGYYTDCGQDVRRAAYYFSEADLPGISLFPLSETAAAETVGISSRVMPVQARAVFAHDETNTPSVYGEKVLGDLITCLCGIEKRLAFTSGGTYAVKAGDTVTGATSHATAVVLAVTLTSGSWAGGNAAGTLRMRTQTGTFGAENLDVGTNLNVATIAGNSSDYPAKWAATGSTKDQVIYKGGGIDDYPQPDDMVTVVTANFDVHYQTVAASPYTRP